MQTWTLKRRREWGDEEQGNSGVGDAQADLGAHDDDDGQQRSDGLWRVT
jgi:hypothetical protein